MKHWGEQDALAAGYAFVRFEGHVWAAWRRHGGPGPVPERSAGRQFSTATWTGRQDALGVGYAFVRTEGFIHPAAVTLKTRGGAFVGVAQEGGVAAASQVATGPRASFELAYRGAGRVALRMLSGRFLGLDATPACRLVADRREDGAGELFQAVAAPGNRVGLRAANGRFVRMGGAGGILAADSPALSGAERFELVGV